MGTPENFGDLVNLVKDALAPDAAPQTREKAANLLRSLIGVLGAPQQANPNGETDVLQSLIDRFASLIPNPVRENLPRLNIPMVPVHERKDS